MPQSLTRAEVLAAKQAMVDLAAAAEYLDVSIKTLRRRIADGSLPAFRVGPKVIRVYLDDLESLKSPIGVA